MASRLVVQTNEGLVRERDERAVLRGRVFVCSTPVTEGNKKVISRWRQVAICGLSPATIENIRKRLRR